MPDQPDSAIVLLSGGLDSSTVLAIAMSQGLRVHALSFRYGQRHALECEAARRVAARAGVAEHRFVDLDPGLFAGSALTSGPPVPKARARGEIGDGIPLTYVPARNILFLSHALAWAESLGAASVWLGVNAIDYSGYPDCRPEFIEAYQRAADLGTRRGVEGRPIVIQTPLIQLTKAEIIQWGHALGVDYSLTQSCYDPDPAGLACGLCEACALRRNGFMDAGVPDPTRYAARGAP